MKILLYLAALLPIALANAQIKWPNPPKNLKILPKNITKDQLERTMFGFSSALGVNCVHCHVAKEFGDLSTYEWASDDKQTKQIARIMLQMVKNINETELKKISAIRAPSINVTCATCHNGKSLPQSLDRILADVIKNEGVKAGIQKYRDLRKKYYGRATYDFGQDGLNQLGYDLLGDNKIEDAIAIFRLNVEMNPDDSNVYDSLGEAYMKTGNKWLAIINYSKSLELDPQNKNAIEMLNKLSGEGVK